MFLKIGLTNNEKNYIIEGGFMTNKLDTFSKDIQQDRLINGNSTNWANWQSKLTIVTCKNCKDQHGKIFDISALNGRLYVYAHP